MKKKKIVFLDAATVDLGDIDISPLKRQGRLVVYGRSRTSQIVSRSRDAEIIITNKCLFGEREFEKLPKLRLICVAATGVNNIDLAAAARRNIAVANVVGYSTRNVAQQTLLFLLALSHRLLDHHQASVDGRWSRSLDFALLDYSYSGLEGKVLGIVGFGAIGREVARLATTVGMRVLATRRTPLEKLLRTADFVSLHCPLTPETRHLIDRKSLRLMKRSASLLNLARGAVVCEEEVARALAKNRLRAYATDVFATEPPPRNHPLFRRGIREKILVTPHIAWASRESRQSLVNEIAKNIAKNAKIHSTRRINIARSRHALL